jgi:anaerobic magnesium-protoporphyrin IX monomethyl ester cyclase
MCRQYGFACTVLDGVVEPDLTPARVVERVARHRRVVLGFHLMGGQWVTGANTLWELLRARGVDVRYTLAGGNYATIYRDEVCRQLPWLDRLVVGEGEFELIRELYRVMYGQRGGRGPSISPFTIVDPLNTPPPDHYALGLLGDDPIEVLTSRGCPGKCSFCEVACFYGKTRKAWRRRSVAAVRREILDIHARTGQVHFPLLDDAFLYGGESSLERRHLLASLAYVKRRVPAFSFNIFAKPETVRPEVFAALRGVGLHRVFLGIESFDARWLRLLKKAHQPLDGIRALQTCRDLGLEVEIGFIMIAPIFGIQDVRHQLRCLREYATFATIQPAKLVDGLWNGLMLYRHTKIFADFKQRGWLREDVYDSEYEIYGYTVDPKVGAYRAAMRELLENRPRAATLAEALAALSAAEQLCERLEGA